MEYIEIGLEGRKNSIVSVLAGTLFAVGWWLFIDISCQLGHLNFLFLICGIFGTLSLIIVNSLKIDDIVGDVYSGGILGPKGLRIVLFVGYFVGFSSVLISGYLSIYYFLEKEKPSIYHGLGSIVFNVLILISSLLLKLVKDEDDM